MALGKYFKTPNAVKRYSIDWSDWLDLGETISGVTFAVTPVDASPVVISGNTINTAGTGITFYAGGGVDKTNYSVIATMNSSGGQVDDRDILIIVRNPS